jgi:uncharacterized membrane protein YhhN
VNAATAVAFALAAVFAVGNWIAVGKTDRTHASRVLEYVCKPATLVALIAAAALLDPAADAQTWRAWFVAALVFSLAGDVLLMLPQDLFVAGLAAFLVAHVFYLVGFWTNGPSAFALAIAVVLVVAVVGPLGWRILSSIVRTGEPRELRGAVAGYMLVISAMLATALATGNVVAAVGAGLFVASDSMIAWNRFVRPFRGAPVAIMVTYHLGQAGLVLALLR